MHLKTVDRKYANIEIKVSSLYKPPFSRDTGDAATTVLDLLMAGALVEGMGSGLLELVGLDSENGSSDLSDLDNHNGFFCCDANGLLSGLGKDLSVLLFVLGANGFLSGPGADGGESLFEPGDPPFSGKQ